MDFKGMLVSVGFSMAKNTYSSFDVIGKDDRCFQQVATVMVGICIGGS